MDNYNGNGGQYGNRGNGSYGGNGSRNNGGYNNNGYNNSYNGGYGGNYGQGYGNDGYDDYDDYDSNMNGSGGYSSGAGVNKYASKYGVAYSDTDMGENGILYDENGEVIEAVDPRQLMWKRIFLGIKIFTIIVLIGVLVGGIYFWNAYGVVIQESSAWAKSENIGIERFKKSNKIKYLDTDGAEIESMTSGDKIYVASNDMPAAVAQIFVAIEDRDFYNHDGISYKGIVRAAVSIIKNKGEATQGASTITQQLAKNIFLDFDKTMTRKFKEIFMAMELEDEYDKEEIMEFYINNINYGNGYTGIGAAAEGYFGKTAAELTLAELAYVCSVPNNPKKYNPYTVTTEEEIAEYGGTDEDTATAVEEIRAAMDGKSNIFLKRRATRVLDQLKAAGDITDAQYTEAINTEVEFNQLDEKAEQKLSYSARKYIEYCAVRHVMKQVFNFEFRYGFEDRNSTEANDYFEKYAMYYTDAQNWMAARSINIHTTIDMDAQAKLQEEVDTVLLSASDGTQTNPDNVYGETEVYNLQGSAVCIDNSNQKVIAIVGNRTQEGVLSGGNRARDSYRQPGSAIKPLLDYGPAFDWSYRHKKEYDKYSPDYTGIYDINLKKDDRYKDLNPPENANGKYRGEGEGKEYPFREAIERSVNTIPWLLMKELKPENCLVYLEEMDFDRITYNDAQLSASIGGVQYGTNTVEMSAAYATIANNGKYKAPTCIEDIRDESGESLMGSSKEKVIQVYGENACKMLTDCMIGVIEEEWGTGHKCKLNNFTAAAKTGTTNDNKDAWFCGYTAEYTTTVWVGKDNSEAIEKMSGGGVPGTIWKNFMNYLHESKQKKELDIDWEFNPDPATMETPTPEPTETPEPTATWDEFPIFTETPGPGLDGEEWLDPDGNPIPTEDSNMEVTADPVITMPPTETTDPNVDPNVDPSSDPNAQTTENPEAGNGDNTEEDNTDGENSDNEGDGFWGNIFN